MNATLGEDGAMTTVTGTLRYVQRRITKQGLPWATAILNTSDGRVPLSIFPKAYAERQPLTTGQTVTVTGRVDRRGKRAARVVALAAGSLADARR